MKKILLAFLLLTALCAFSIKTPLNGVWEYAGGIYNGKVQAASTDYKLHRKYDAGHYEALFIEDGEKPVTYEKGDYELKQDTCLEKQTYSSQPSKVIGITVKYRYQIKNDTLTFSGMLPNGTTVQEYWKKVK